VHEGGILPPPPVLRDAELLYDGDELDLYRLAGPLGPAPRTPPMAPVIAGDVAAAALFLAAVCTIWVVRHRRAANVERHSISAH
jgi:hypothetical protein